jgi:hypothetical protein
MIRLTTKIGSLTEIRTARAWEETNRLRTAGARTLVNAAIAEGVKVFIQESVAFVYRDGGTDWVTEDSPTDDGATPILAAASKAKNRQHASRKLAEKELSFALGFLRSRHAFEQRDGNDGAKAHAGTGWSWRELLFVNLRSGRGKSRRCGRRPAFGDLQRVRR